MEQVEIIQICKRFSGLPTQGLADLWTACEGTDDLEGAVVECGVLNGGAGAALWHAAGARRHLWLFDSFAGMPEPTEQDGGRAGCQYAYRTARPEGWNIGETKNVKRVLSLVKVPRKLTHIVTGWFADTLPGMSGAIGSIVAIHLDADFYEPTRIALQYLYPLLVPGGVVIVDDYGGWEGCKLAVDEFWQANSITTHTQLYGSVVMWRKEA